jgi:hypothetical protein
MQCKECGNDLMLSIEPGGWKKIIRILPLAEYRCLRCGYTALRFSASGYRTAAFRILLVALVLAGMGAAIWYSDLASRPPAERRDIDTAAVKRRAVDPPAAEKPEPAAVTARAEAEKNNAPGPESETAAEPPAGASRAAQAPAANATLAKTAEESTGDSENATEKAAKPSEASPGATPAEDPTPDTAVEAAERERTLGSVQTLAEKGEVMVSLLADGPVESHSSFPLRAPPRWVIDLPGRWTYAGPKGFGIESPDVERVRLGVHPDKLRIVIDYNEKKPPEPIVKTMPHGLIVIVR